MTYPTNQIPSINPQNFAIATPIGLQSAPRDPNAQDNTFIPGWEWQNTVTKMFWKCVSATIAGAVWEPFVPNSSGTVSELTGNSGGAVGPDGAGNINVVGDGTTITIAGNPGTNTLTASLVGGGIPSQSYVTNLNSPVVPTAAGVIDLNASTSTYTDGAVANTIKIELQGTNHALFVGRGALTPATTIATGTSGQALVSAGAGSDPAFGTLGVAGGGTGDTSFTPYEVIVANTTGTGALTQVSGVGVAGQVLTSNGAAAFPTWQNSSVSAFTSVAIQTITSTGTYTPTSGMLYCVIEVLGGGGAGGGAAATAAGQYSAGAGGSAGEYARGVFSAATIGVSQAVTIGAGGTGNSAAPGNAGTATSVGALISANGGGGGGVTGATAGAIQVLPSVGGTGGAGGSFRSAGSVGAPGDAFKSTNATGGKGGDTLYGAGGNYSINISPGNAGLGYGSGGSGCANNDSKPARTGGAGAGGIVIITEYI